MAFDEEASAVCERLSRLVGNLNDVMNDTLPRRERRRDQARLRPPVRWRWILGANGM
jgi:hypothetical protein